MRANPHRRSAGAITNPPNAANNRKKSFAVICKFLDGFCDKGDGELVVAASGPGAHGLGELLSIGVLLNDAVDLGRAALPID